MGIITQNDVLEIETQTNDEPTKSLETILTEKGISEAEILKAKGEDLKIPTKLLKDVNVSIDVLKLLPEQSVNYYQFIPIGMEDNILEVGLVNPDNLEAKDALQFITSKNNLNYKIFAITEKDFKELVGSYKGLSNEVSRALSELETELSADEKELSASIEQTEKSKPSEEAVIIEEAPVTKIVATMLRYATEGNASDIHIEHMEDRVRVRFRVDGLLNTSLVLPVKVHSAVVARIKILSNMKLDEKRKPQDGRFSAHIDGRKIDFRVSTFPAYYGEKVVMRILDSEKGAMNLEDMGMTERNLSLIKAAIRKPYGMILISGPTGSGKTTTLYSMLNEVDKEQKNVLSLEDPVEYNVAGMSQSQVRPEIGYTFANGLRTALRQDPDVIMVGEIRDKETAKLAIQAALTGHLVLSTIHTNTSVGVIPRLIDMGVDPYLIAPTLILAIAQRLVRKLCPDGGKPLPIEGSIKVMIDKEFGDLPEDQLKKIKLSDKIYGISPTSECPSGTKGRVAVFETLEIDRDIEEIILTDPNEPDILKEARKKGMLTMRQDAILKAMDRVIPFEEVGKV